MRLRLLIIRHSVQFCRTIDPIDWLVLRSLKLAFYPTALQFGNRFTGIGGSKTICLFPNFNDKKFLPKLKVHAVGIVGQFLLELELGLSNHQLEFSVWKAFGGHFTRPSLGAWRRFSVEDKRNGFSIRRRRLHRWRRVGFWQVLKFL